MKIMLFALLLTISIASAEDRVKIAIIDSGVRYSQSTQPYMCKDGITSTVGTSPYDNHGHGSNIISIISPSINPKTHCIHSYKVWYNNISGTDSINGVVEALRMISMDEKVKYVNISMVGKEPNYRERMLVRLILSKGVTITTSAGNEGANLTKNCNFFPACYRETIKNNKFYVVKSKLKSSNYGSVITDEYSGDKVGTPVMSGTSQASAQKMADILKSVVYSNRRTND